MPDAPQGLSTGKTVFQRDLSNVAPQPNDRLILGIDSDQTTKPILYSTLVAALQNDLNVNSSNPYEIPRRAILGPVFADANNPTDAEVKAYVLGLDPVPNAGTVLVQGDSALEGNGSLDNPENAWQWDGADVTRIKDMPKRVEIPAAAFAAPSAPTRGEINAYLAAQSNSFPEGNDIELYLIGSGDRYNPDYIWVIRQDMTDTNFGDVTLVKAPVTKEGNFFYDAYTGADVSTSAFVTASALGVTYTENQATGEYFFAVPEGVWIFSGTVIGVSADGDAGNELFVQFNYANNTLFNQNIQTVQEPKFYIGDGESKTITRVNTSDLALTLPQKLSALGGGNVEFKLDNATTFYDPFRLKFHFPANPFS